MKNMDCSSGFVNIPNMGTWVNPFFSLDLSFLNCETVIKSNSTILLYQN